MDIVLSEYQLGILSAGAIIAGILILIKSGDWTISASVEIARRANLSPMFIGATIVAFGTSLPELFTSVNANIQGFPGISLGNIVGSNVANILLVIGASALFCNLSVKRSIVARDLAVMLFATFILVVGMLHGIFLFWMGALMFGFLAAFIFRQYKTNEIDTSEVEEVEPMSFGTAAWMIIGGFAGLTIGSEILVNGAVSAGLVLGVPESVIGITAVAIGTSLPELTASIAAAIKRQTDILFGNIIGSNTFNILSIVAITAMIKPIEVPVDLIGYSMWSMAFVSIAFAAWLVMSRTINRFGGFFLLLCFFLFTVFQFVSFSDLKF